LAIVGYEAIIIVVILAVIFLWGPNKVPEIARAIGQAKREFDKASKETTTLVQQAMALPPTPSAPASSTTATPTSTDPLIIAAKSLGITTEGKTKEELAKEIVGRTAQSSVQLTGKEPLAAAP
jgi:sec-independent protein translocase protein TatA